MERPISRCPSYWHCSWIKIVTMTETIEYENTPNEFSQGFISGYIIGGICVFLFMILIRGI